jgi:o-succinylbenzoate synthase
MKGLKLNIQEKTLRLQHPIQTARGPIESRSILEIKLTDPSGAIGLGEASPLPGYSIDNFDECKNELHSSRDAIESLAPNDLWQGIVLSCRNLGLSPAAQHAVEGALWDLSSSLRTIEPEEMLGVEPRHVPLHRLVHDTDSALEASQAGYVHFKVKVGHEDSAESMNRIRRISNVLPENARIRLDANGKWLPENLLALADDLHKMKVWAIEEPISGLKELAELKEHCSLKILADESVRSAEDLEECLRLNSAHGVVLKPMLVGGPLSTFALAQKAIQAGLMVSITTTFDGPIARASATRIASCLGGTQLLSCGLETGRFFNPPQDEIAHVLDGSITLGSHP